MAREVQVLAIDLFLMLPTLLNSTYVDASPLSTVPWEKGEQGYHPWEQQVLARARVASREASEDSVTAVEAKMLQSHQTLMILTLVYSTNPASKKDSLRY